MTWYRSQCNGTWEHAYGVTIESLDNAGWLVTIDLIDTALQNASMQPLSQARSENDWLSCQVDHGRFRGAGDAHKLLAVLQAFQNWASGASKVE